ncbi:hypothetical protein DRW07_17740 [Alteromonas sediminis]|uniref:Virulence-associated protein E-like domain-containing protein n=1 Tax=Alteromonas sediminis TaxID=2259342 RepID=A0A3N5Y4N9_9ALTE|nr:VapE domain-containing protein [Alteromonas sediminis]RPJ65149.1 hypothetical protein DRW07_17740 [Alteromonas sediminis]
MRQNRCSRSAEYANKPRQSNFIASVNGADFLKDDTGSTRFAVIEMEKAADMDKLNEILGWSYDGTGAIEQIEPQKLHQFWLEVKVMYENGAGWQLTDEEVKTIQQINRSFNDNGSWYDYILDALIMKDSLLIDLKDWFNAGDIAQSGEDFRAQDTRQIGKALARLEQDGYLKGEKRNGNRKYYRVI